jgi:8-hydroxy-5-deazaflavin:NADPH oxidoreductase
MLIAIVGAGNVGGALGQGWSRAGHTIRYGVVDPADAKHALAARTAGGAQVVTVAEAALGADVIVLAVPWNAVADALKACGDLANRVVIDVTNPLRMGAQGLELAVGFDDSGAETIARLAPGASVFKAMNQVGYEVMSDASGYAAPPVMFVAGDDAARKPAVLALVRDLGFDAVDAGPLRLARLLEPHAMLWIHMAINQRAPRDNAFAFLRRDRERAGASR